MAAKVAETIGTRIIGTEVIRMVTTMVGETTGTTTTPTTGVEAGEVDETEGEVEEVTRGSSKILGCITRGRRFGIMMNGECSARTGSQRSSHIGIVLSEKRFHHQLHSASTLPLS